MYVTRVLLSSEKSGTYFRTEIKSSQNGVLDRPSHTSITNLSPLTDPMKILTNKKRLVIIDFIDQYDYYCTAPIIKNILSFLHLRFIYTISIVT